MFLNPSKIIENHIQLLPGMKIADFGAGRGDFAIAASNKIGINGAYYAIDIKNEALNAIKNSAKGAGFKNIHTIKADIERPFSTTLKNNSLHCIILSNVLFQLESKESVVREAHRVLQPNGKAYVIDWRNTRDDLKEPYYKTVKIGPKTENRISKNGAINLFEIRGFDFLNEFPAGDQHYGLIFKKI